MEIRALKEFKKEIVCAPDKSVTHRAVMFNAYASGKATVYNPLLGEDCISTIDCMRRLGASIDVFDNRIEIRSAKLKSAELYVGNSGTTLRLLTGLLAGLSGVNAALDGDGSIRKRPMNRVIEPLVKMGAQINSNNGLAPVEVTGKRLAGITYEMPISSAQVKSAILLAGLNADGVTKVIEKVKSRDHTERMLAAMGADIRETGGVVEIRASALKAADVNVCGDISSAAYAMALAAVMRGGEVLIKNVGINPTRTGIIDVLKESGARVEYTNIRHESEPVADVYVARKTLKPFTVGRDIMPRLIDEIPVLALYGCFCEGVSVIKDAQELKVKESNRIKTTVCALKSMGADIEETFDGMIIRGKAKLKGGVVLDTFGDHRIAMAMSVAAALSEEGATIKNAECAAVSYPNFYKETFGL